MVAALEAARPRSISHHNSSVNISRTECGRFLIETSPDLADFARGWPALADVDPGAGVCANPFQCRDHLAIWLETIGAATGTRPHFARISDGEPLMLLPLGVVRRAGIRRLEFLDAGVADYNAPVLFPRAEEITEPEMREVWSAVARSAPPFDAVLLTKMPEFVHGRRNPLCCLASECWPQSGHEINLTVEGEPLQPRRDYRDSRRKRARLAALGALTLTVAESGDEIDDVFETFIRDKTRRYMETLGQPGFDVPGQRSYYFELIRRLSGRGVQLLALRVGNEIIATAIGFTSGKRFYYMMCASGGGTWLKYSPGRLLLEELVDRSISQRLEFFDFGIGDEAYKLRWRQRDIPLRGATTAHTLAGRAWCGAQGVRTRLRRRLPQFAIRALKGVLRKNRQVDS